MIRDNVKMRRQRAHELLPVSPGDAPVGALPGLQLGWSKAEGAVLDRVQLPPCRSLPIKHSIIKKKKCQFST